MDPEVEPILEKVKEQLKSRGAESIGALGRAFKVMDDNGDRKLSKDDMYYGLTDYGCDITQGECATLYTFWDKNGDGVINFDEFLIGLRGEMNEVRKAVCDKAYEKMDSTGDGQVSMEDVRKTYNVDSHPKFQSGEMTADQIFAQFMGRMGDGDGDGNISKQEWYDYYNGISASVDNDEEFVLILTNAWKLDE